MIIRHLLDLLTPRERRNLYFLFAAVLVMAGLEVVSVASIMPFLSVASDPASIHENTYLSWAFDAFGFEDTHAFLVALGALALSALVVSNTFIVFVTWLQERYVWNRNHSISKRLLQRYLQQPYEFFLTKNSSDLSKNILEETREVTAQMLLPALRGLAKGLVALAIIGFLVFVDPLVAFVVSVVLGGAYVAIYALVRRKLDTIGAERVESNRARYQSVSEAFGGVKEVKLRGTEDVFLEQFDRPSKKYAHYKTLNQVINKAPRYILEAVAFGGIILIAVYFIAVRSSIQQVIPMLGLYAFAGYRLMPALQQAFKGVAKARFNRAALRTLNEALSHQSQTGRNTINTASETRAFASDTNDVKLNDRLVVDGITFTYPDAHRPAIHDLSLEIPAWSTVGFVGKTGSGKTTAVDLILGLLQPQRGSIRIDGVPLQETNLKSWQSEIGYVPQHIYLTDDTIAQNVAFGVPAEEIDYDAVRKSLEMAQIAEFVEHELPGGLDSIVGERGVKLSGGQRQRLGIARALYHQPSVVFFDEATSALDQKTEREVMESIYALEGSRTIIMISHRLSTVQRADRIFMLENGRLVGCGTYEELERSSESFQLMIDSYQG
jgi:ATP-binding cassette subfamily C protein